MSNAKNKPKEKQTVNLREDLYSFEKWKETKAALLQKQKIQQEKKEEEERQKEAEKRAQALQTFLAWKAARDAEEAKRRAKEKADKKNANLSKIREEEEKKRNCKKAFEVWLQDKKKQQSRLRRKLNRKKKLEKATDAEGMQLYQGEGLDVEAGAATDSNDDEAPNLAVQRKKQEAQRAFKFWLTKKNEQRDLKLKRMRRRQKMLERRAKRRDEEAQTAYESWLESISEREELDKDVIDRMRDLALTKPPWIPNGPT